MVNSKIVYLEIESILTQAGIEDAGFDADVLFSFVTGTHRLQSKAVTPEQYATLVELAEHRALREPLQYLVGSWDFLNLRLNVGPGVLIPRPETEEVCLAAARLLEGIAQPRVLDLCAGTGALALGIQSLCPGADVTAVELYDEAFRYLVENVEAYHGVWPRVPLAVQADVEQYAAQLPPGGVDLIVSNPPYVREEELAHLAPELAFEPQTALVAPEDGLHFYTVIGAQYGKALKPGGQLVLEVGKNQADAVCGILSRQGYVDLTKLMDLSGIERIVSARKK